MAVGHADGPVDPPTTENMWIGPIPDRRVVSDADDPAEQAEVRESVRLAFVAALQHLPAAPTRGADPARSVEVEGDRGRGAARHHGRVGEQRAATGARRRSPSATSPPARTPQPIDDAQRGAARALRRHVRALRHRGARRVAARRRRRCRCRRTRCGCRARTSTASWLHGPGGGCEGSRLGADRGQRRARVRAVARRSRRRLHRVGDPRADDLRRRHHRAWTSSSTPSSSRSSICRSTSTPEPRRSTPEHVGEPGERDQVDERRARVARSGSSRRAAARAAAAAPACRACRRRAAAIRLDVTR